MYFEDSAGSDGRFAIDLECMVVSSFGPANIWGGYLPCQETLITRAVEGGRAIGSKGALYAAEVVRRAPVYPFTFCSSPPPLGWPCC